MTLKIYQDTRNVPEILLILVSIKDLVYSLFPPQECRCKSRSDAANSTAWRARYGLKPSPRLSDHPDKANNTIAEANERFFDMISVCGYDFLERAIPDYQWRVSNDSSAGNDLEAHVQAI